MLQHVSNHIAVGVLHCLFPFMAEQIANDLTNEVFRRRKFAKKKNGSKKYTMKMLQIIESNICRCCTHVVSRLNGCLPSLLHMIVGIVLASTFVQKSSKKRCE